jgi:hypothetical protein
VAARAEAAATSTTEVPIILPDETIGKMVRRLRQRSGGGWRMPGKRPFTDEQIATALRITVEEVKEHGKPHQPHTEASVKNAFVKWLAANKRWPTQDDWKHWRTNGLPERTAVGRHIGSLDTLTRSIISDDKLFKKLTPQMILGIRNVTLRRDAIEKYGGDQALLLKIGTKFQEDEFGVLWEMPAGPETTDKVARFVQVTNSTAEPDGSFATYFLRVPPDTATAKAAVEWSFNVELDEGFTVET